MEYEIIRLSNGIRVVFQPQNLSITHACMLINAGSRDEKKVNLVLHTSLSISFLKERNAEVQTKF